MAKFNLDSVLVLYGLLPIKGGWGEGDDVIGVEQVDPSVVAKQGASGDVTFMVTRRKLAKVTLKFQRTSLNNAMLSAVMIAQREGNVGGGPLSIKDGANFILSPEAMIEGPPKQAFGSVAGDLEWTLLAADCEVFIGGYP